jgi:hypothetical protein
LNNAYTNTNAEVQIEFFPDATDSNVSEQVLIQDVSWMAGIESTIVRQPISLSLIGKNVSNSIPDFYKI